MSAQARPRVSIVIVAYDMPRQLERTVLSLSPRLQRDVTAEDYELIVVDNGSRPAVRASDLESTGAVSYTHLTLPTNREV